MGIPNKCPNTLSHQCGLHSWVQRETVEKEAQSQRQAASICAMRDGQGRRGAMEGLEGRMLFSSLAGSDSDSD